MRGNRYLVLKGRTWWFHRDVPVRLRPTFDGQKTYVVNLKTSDLKVAQQLRDALYAETEKHFAGGNVDGISKIDSVTKKALLYDAERRKYDEDNWKWLEEKFGLTGAESDDELSGLLTPYDWIEIEVEQIERKFSKDDLNKFLGIAHGGIPVDHHIEEHLKLSPISEKLKMERRRIVQTFVEWKPGLTLSKVDRAIAGQFVRETLERQHHSTANKKLMNLRGYWAWMAERGIVPEESNPWKGQKVKAPRKQPADQKERSFEVHEIETLLTAPFPIKTSDAYRSRLMDLMLIAALSGMRIEEICQLKVGDCRAGLFTIHDAKTGAGQRKIPIHSNLVEIVERRTAQKPDDDYLIHEIKMGAPGLPRSDDVSKQFTHYRRKLGVDDVVEGQRRSRVNFHSFRRWFITQALRAGQPPHIVEAVDGHKPQGMTLGVYSAGPSEQQMRECVEAVRLPAGVELVP